MARWFLGLLAAILLGAIGSGVWQYLGDPAYVWLRDALLNLATLGLTSLKDALYADVAKGLYERSSSLLLTMVLFAIPFCIIIVLLRVKSRVRELEDKLDEGSRSGHAVNSGDVQQQIYQMIRLVKRLLLFLWPWTVVMSILVAFLAINIIYTSRAIAHYRQLTAVVGPYISEDEMKVYDSRFAQIRSAQDYVDLTGELVNLGAEYGLTIPEFQPW